MGRVLARRPKDAVGLGLTLAAIGFILLNALFLQAGPHPAPFFANAAPRAPSATTGAISAKTVGYRGSPAARAGAGGNTQASAPRGADGRSDPIAELLEPSNRLIAVQRALAEFGYGQIKPTGTPGPETRAAIEKFERERNLPVTGKISERLTHELAVMKGGPL
jgi:hypothetical protein